MRAALIIGRFQPFHKGHEFLIKKALKENDSVIIAVGSSQESRNKINPFNYSERKKMISSVFKNAKIISSKDYKSDEEWADNLMAKAKFNVVYSNNNLVKKIFEKKKIKVIKVKKLPKISGTLVREMMVKNENYEGLLPHPVSDVLKEIGCNKIIKESFKIKK